MGGGGYSIHSRNIRANAMGYDTRSAEEIFSNSFDPSMNPKGVTLRESRDSEEHPHSLAIMLVLDVTGSMGRIPLELVRRGLPKMVGRLIELGIKDPQIMFTAITDHLCGNMAPLQISQFESSDEMLDHWLTKVWLEGGGGGNDGESYTLAHYFAGKYTSIDCFEKGREKGFLISIGDDKPHASYSSRKLEELLGGEHPAMTREQMIDMAKEKYNVFHIHTGDEASRGVIRDWTNLLGENFYHIPNHEEIPYKIAEIIAQRARRYHTEVSPDLNEVEDFNNGPGNLSAPQQEIEIL
jgi:hypothetical protein